MTELINFTEIWREYVGYDVDLSVTLPSDVSDGGSLLSDGNLTTCIDSSQTKSTGDFKVQKRSANLSPSHLTISKIG